MPAGLIPSFLWLGEFSRAESVPLFADERTAKKCGDIRLQKSRGHAQIRNAKITVLDGQ
jgi:hypothetical protein